MGVCSVGGGFCLWQDSACAHSLPQEVLEPMAEWFYATEYISAVSLAFQDLRRQIVIHVVFFNQ